MSREGVLERVERLSQLDVSTLSNADTLAALGDVKRVRSWAEGRAAALRRRLNETAVSPGVARADADEVSGASQGASRRDEQRADTTGTVPEAQEALDIGDINAEHVDALASAFASLEPDERDLLAGMGRELIDQALGTNPDQYRARLRALVDRLRRDAGQGRLERQKRATRLMVWFDKDTGMWRMSGWFDPELAALMSQQLSAALRSRFAQEVPPLCPSDKDAKVHWLRAHALADLFAAASGGAPGQGRARGRATHGGGSQAEVSIVITSPDGHVDAGSGQQVSPEFVADLIHRGVARHFTIITHDGQVIAAPGRLDLGRATRVANRAQRRALHALYPTCAMPGCSTDYRLCRLHHVQWWRHGGRTDLANLLPVCHAHHHAIHEEGWQVALGPHRELTVTRPDGKTSTTGPPGRGP